MKEHWEDSSFLFLVGLIIMPVAILSSLISNGFIFLFFFSISMLFFFFGFIRLTYYWISKTAKT
jgi:hypothetical protein